MGIAFQERTHEVIHRNEKLKQWYDSFENPIEMLAAIRTVRFIMDNFPQTRNELLGKKIYESTNINKRRD